MEEFIILWLMNYVLEAAKFDPYWMISCLYTALGLISTLNPKYSVLGSAGVRLPSCVWVLSVLIAFSFIIITIINSNNHLLPPLASWRFLSISLTLIAVCWLFFSIIICCMLPPLLLGMCLGGNYCCCWPLGVLTLWLKVIGLKGCWACCCRWSWDGDAYREELFIICRPGC